ncbi:DUF4190 domain-containing protein [Microbacterium oleivorans]|uniref:ERCC4-like helicase n=1 Tax=Microbacterium oleivorans TaxID=273677 RepID=A0A031FNU7_9MICO|nr:DUF4190 domain-containing protein [Microbacterium oleivorans]AZS43342.1 hypothetical protein BWL13_00897 [Microbacterium oleivorans]EZP25300.1 ERCC4-like helicase [Microbacterium oleivorans]THE06785.1 DUF4190 domain-containing protein [Microbacterium oleivorans]
MTDPNQPNSQNIPPAPPAYEAPAYGNAPQYSGAPAAGPKPGRTMGIVALILAIIPFTQLIGLILGIVALVQSRKAGAKNGLALAAIIVSIVLMIVGIIIFFALVWPPIAAGMTCASDPTAIVNVYGVDVPCSQVMEQSGQLDY